MSEHPARRTGTLFVALGLAMIGLTLFWESWQFGGDPDIGRLQLLASGPAFLTTAIGVALCLRSTRELAPFLVRSMVAVGTLTALSSVVALSAVVERGRDFRYDRTTGVEKAYRRLKSSGLANFGVCRCVPDRTERSPLPGGFTTRLSVYDRGGPDPRPGVLIAHGNTWLGSDLSTYRVLASHLADRGYLVATFDFPGFGQADDPFGRGPSNVAHAYDRPAILSAAVDWLARNNDVDSKGITLLGHSGGVAWAMRVALEHPRVSSVAVMVTPPPPVIGRGLERGAPGYDSARSAYLSQRFGEQYEFVYGQPVPQWYRWELAQPDGRYSDDVFAKYAEPGHKALLVILGERDEPGGHDAVRSRFDSLAEPKKLVVLPGSDHYLNTAQTLGLVVYDTRIARHLTEVLVGWIESFRAGRSETPWPAR